MSGNYDIEGNGHMIDQKNEFFKTALFYHSQNDFKKALQYYDKVLALGEDHSICWYNKGVILLHSSDLTNAIKCFDKAIEYDPTNALSWNNKGIACIQAGVFFKANHCFSKSIQNDQTKAEFWLNKKIALEFIGKPDEAQICYEKFKKFKEYPNVTHTPNINTCNVDAERIKKGKVSFEFPFVLKGQKNFILFSVYERIYEFLHKNRPITKYDDDFRDCVFQFLHSPIQDNYLAELLVKIIDKSPENIDDQARIAINLVQHIPYGEPAELIKRVIYPYEVVYLQEGVCSYKSLLLVYLLSKLGYDTALFLFHKENHMAMGVKCPSNFSFKNSGYTFVESTVPSIPTDENLEYSNNRELLSNPDIVQISSGKSFETINEEFSDAKELHSILCRGNQITEREFLRYIQLKAKYGIK